MNGKKRKGLLTVLVMFVLVMAFALSANAASGTVKIKKQNGKYYLYSTATNRKVKKRAGRHEFPAGSGNYYYFKTSRTGEICRRTYIRTSSKRVLYYAGGNGQLWSGWKKFKNNRLYFNPKTNRAAVGITKIGGKSYYFNRRGYRRSGLIKYNGSYYFFNPYMIKNRWVKYKGNIYYFSSSGKAVTGSATLTYKGKKSTFFFNSKGVLTDAKSYVKYSSAVNDAWYIQINQGTQVITVFHYGVPVKAMRCSTGLAPNTTPDGLRYIGSKYETWTLNGPTYGHYCSHMVSHPGETFSSILIHSTPALDSGHYSVQPALFNRLGYYASHGCCRLNTADAYYIYYYCPIGTKIYIFHGTSADDPLGKPKQIIISGNWDPTDPYFTGNWNPSIT